MNKNTLYLVIALGIIFGALLYFGLSPRFGGKAQSDAINNITDATSTPSAPAAISLAGFDAKNSTFLLDKEKIALKNGQAEIQTVPNSASKIIVRYFGNEALGDLNGDKRDDFAFLVTVDNGGSGTYYYVVAVINKTDAFKTTNAYLIGDRIAPQSTSIDPKASLLLVNYADRNPNEPMSAQPSVGKTLTLKINSAGKLVEMKK